MGKDIVPERVSGTGRDFGKDGVNFCFVHVESEVPVGHRMESVLK